MQVCSLHLYYKSISQDKQSKFPLHFLEKENCSCRFVWGNYHPYPYYYYYYYYYYFSRKCIGNFDCLSCFYFILLFLNSWKKLLNFRGWHFFYWNEMFLIRINLLTLSNHPKFPEVWVDWEVPNELLEMRFEFPFTWLALLAMAFLTFQL